MRAQKTTRLQGVQAVLFDLDGTLVVTHIDFPAMRQAVLTTALDAGVTPEAIRNLDILGMVRRASEMVRERDGDVAAASLLARAEAVMEAAEMRGLDGAYAAPYASEVLRALSDAAIGVAIVTRNCRRAVDAVLSLAGLGCSVVLTREDVAHTKPHPEHLLTALARLGVPPDRAVMVGDHTMDVEAGRTAGTRTVGLLHPNRPPEFFDSLGPDLVISDLRGLLPFVIEKS